MPLALVPCLGAPGFLQACQCHVINPESSISAFQLPRARLFRKWQPAQTFSAKSTSPTAKGPSFLGRLQLDIQQMHGKLSLFLLLFVLASLRVRFIDNWQYFHFVGRLALALVLFLVYVSCLSPSTKRVVSIQNLPERAKSALRAPSTQRLYLRCYMLFNVNVHGLLSNMILRLHWQKTLYPTGNLNGRRIVADPTPILALTPALLGCEVSLSSLCVQSTQLAETPSRALHLSRSAGGSLLIPMSIAVLTL
ncbi:hypothetical protein C8F01DRAFT_1092286 [Mycena amicta]|nr:hypothetical protein C8F01DRAFT_1092286 [Mycena amicta]